MTDLIDTMAANLGFVVSQTSAIETAVYKTRFPAIRYPGLIPVDYSAPEWASSVTYFSMDVTGAAAWTGDRSSDIPVVGTRSEKNETAVYMASVGYDFGIEEVSQAQMLGMNLQSDKAMAARLIYERTVDAVAFTGNTEKGWKGLFNSTAVTAASATNGSWLLAATTADKIVADINEVLAAVSTATNTVAMADTLLLPMTRYQRLASVVLTGTNTTVLEHIARANAYTAETGEPLLVRGMWGLDTAGSGSTARMVAYRRSPEVLKLHIPMPHKFLPVQQVGLTYKVPGIFRMGPLDIRLPKEVRYADGI